MQCCQANIPYILKFSDLPVHENLKQKCHDWKPVSEDNGRIIAINIYYYYHYYYLFIIYFLPLIFIWLNAETDNNQILKPHPILYVFYENICLYPCILEQRWIKTQTYLNNGTFLSLFFNVKLLSNPFLMRYPAILW